MADDAIATRTAARFLVVPRDADRGARAVSELLARAVRRCARADDDRLLARQLRLLRWRRGLSRRCRLAVAAGSDSVLILEEGGRGAFYSTAEGLQRAWLPLAGCDAEQVAFSPDGRWAVLCGPDGGVRVLDTTRREQASEAASGIDASRDVVVAVGAMLQEDGALVALVVTQRAMLFRVSFSRERARAAALPAVSWRMFSHTITAACFDGRGTVALAGMGERATEVALGTVTGDGSLGDVRSVISVPTGPLVAVAPGTPARASIGEEVRDILSVTDSGLPNLIHKLVLSADCKAIAAVQGDGHVVVIRPELRTQESLRPLELTASDVGWFAQNQLVVVTTSGEKVLVCVENAPRIFHRTAAKASLRDHITCACPGDGQAWLCSSDGSTAELSLLSRPDPCARIGSLLASGRTEDVATALDLARQAKPEVADGLLMRHWKRSLRRHRTATAAMVQILSSVTDGAWVAAQALSGTGDSFETSRELLKTGLDRAASAAPELKAELEHALDRLDLYSLLVDAQGDVTHSPDEWRSCRSMTDAELTLDCARRGRIGMLRVMVARTRDPAPAATLHRIEVLECIPETTAPSEYEDLLPDSSWMMPIPELAAWFARNALKLDREAGQLLHAVNMCDCGLRRLATADDEAADDLKELRAVKLAAEHLYRLVVDGFLDPCSSLDAWLAAAPREQLDAVLQDADAETVVLRLRQYVQPLVSERADSERLIIEYLTERAPSADGIALCLQIARSSIDTNEQQPERVLASDANLLRLVLDAVYTFGHDDNNISLAGLDMMWDLFECVPPRMPEREATHEELGLLQDRVDALKDHLVCCEVALKYGCTLPLRHVVLVDWRAQNSVVSDSRGQARPALDVCQGLPRALGANPSLGAAMVYRMCVSSKFKEAAGASQEPLWRAVKEDLEAVHSHTAAWAGCPSGWVEECALRSLLEARAFARARECASHGLVEDASDPKLWRIILEASRDLFNSAVEPGSEAIVHAAQCLGCFSSELLLMDDPRPQLEGLADEVAAERRLHEAFSQAHALGLNWMPLELRLCRQPLELVLATAKDNPRASNEQLLALAKLAGAVNSELIVIKSSLARAALERGDFVLSCELCVELLEEAPHDDTVMELTLELLALNKEDALARMDLCRKALTCCNGPCLGSLLACWSELSSTLQAPVADHQTASERAERVASAVETTECWDLEDELHCEAALHRNISTHLSALETDGAEVPEDSCQERAALLKALSACAMVRISRETPRAEAHTAVGRAASLAMAYSLGVDQLPDTIAIASIFTTIVRSCRSRDDEKHAASDATLNSSEINAAEAAIVPDGGLVKQLIRAGFVENGAQRAAVAVSNASFPAALEWAVEHADDANFSDPLPAQVAQSVAVEADPNTALPVFDAPTLVSTCAARSLCVLALSPRVEDPAERRALLLFDTQQLVGSATERGAHPLREPILNLTSQGEDAGRAKTLQRFLPGLESTAFTNNASYRRRVLFDVLTTREPESVAEVCEVAAHYAIDDWELLAQFVKWLLTDFASAQLTTPRTESWTTDVSAALKSPAARCVLERRCNLPYVY